MNKRGMPIAMGFAPILLIAAPAVAKTKEQKQTEVRKQAEQTLARLYKAQPPPRPPSRRRADMPPSAISA